MQDEIRARQVLAQEMAELRRQLCAQGAAWRQQRDCHRLALQQVRRQLAKMRDLSQAPVTLDSIRGALETLEIPFHQCGLNLLNLTDPPTLYSWVWQRDAVAPRSGTWLVADPESGAARVADAWRGGRPVGCRSLADKAGYLGELYGNVGVVLEVPFSHGTLALTRAEPDDFDEVALEFGLDLADLLSIGFEHLELLRDLEASEARYQNLVETPDFVVMLLHPDGSWLYVSPQIEPWLGYAPEDLYREPQAERRLVHPDDREALESALAGAAGGEAVRNLECRWKRKDGDYQWVAASAYPVYEGPSDRALVRAAAVQFVIRDISEQKRAEAGLARAHEGMEQQVRERTAELASSVAELQAEIAGRRQAERENARLEEQLRQSQKMQAVGQLTAGIAHNFNNVLMGIMGNLELASMQVAGPLTSLLGDACTAAERGADMVRELMVFSHQDGAPRPSPAAVNPMLHHVAGICRKTFDRRIDISVSAPEPSPVVSCPEARLEQVLMNLCLNARDAVEAAARASPRIGMQADGLHVADPPPQAEPGHYARMRVSDNGVGMDRATRAHMLEPFFTTKETGRGTGLGLATVYAIVQQARGWIEVESRPGEGTNVSVLLPLTAGEGPGAEADAEDAVRGGTETILVVDDEIEVRNFLGSLLELNGYTALLAADGEEGLEIFERAGDRIELILLDLIMPRVSGPEMLERVRLIDPAIKVVVSTGVADAETPGAQATITKPYRAAAVLRTVRAILDT